MHRPEQGVLNIGKLTRSLIHFLLFFFLTETIYADTHSDNLIEANKDRLEKHHIAMLYSSKSPLQTDIAQKLIKTLIHQRPNLRITTPTPSDRDAAENNTPDLIIAIGLSSIQTANRNYTKSSKLFIVSDPGEFGQKNKAGVNNAILYMTQPYCRQIQMIRLINGQWQSFSYLNNQNDPVDSSQIKSCASKFDLKAHQINISDSARFTDELKNALDHSDLLLALPDKAIFNSNTVKNILLTSYRHRKPVIGFSRNFVIAGALASIHSSREQIAESAAVLVGKYITNDYQFANHINYPQLFDIDINRQVFKALDLNIPDIDNIKQDIKDSESVKPR